MKSLRGFVPFRFPVLVSQVSSFLDLDCIHRGQEKYTDDNGIW